MQFIHLEISDRIATVTLERPPVNALSAEAFRELQQTFEMLGRSRDASVVILTAPGDRIFCAGVDLKDSARRYALELGEGDTVVDQLDPGAVPRDCFWAIRDCPLPVIGAVNGKAIGAGLALLACCDILIASSNAKFSIPEIKVGVLGGARHVQRLVGPAKTRKMLLSGAEETAEEFYRLGAIEAVVPPEQLQSAARTLALDLAANSPIGLRMAKESLNRIEELSLKDGYRIEQDYTMKVGRFDDSAEARRARQENREPVWTWS